MREPELIWTSNFGNLELEFPSYDVVHEISCTYNKEQQREALENAFMLLESQMQQFSTEIMKKELTFNDISTDEMDLKEIQLIFIKNAADELLYNENMNELCEWQNEFLRDTL